MEVSFEEAYNILQKGQVLGVGTDTVYGLAVLPEYLDKLYVLKKRPKNKKIVKMIYNVSQIRQVDDFSLDELRKITQKYWPGTNTLIFFKNGELESFRIPKDQVLLNFLEKFNLELYVTSANMSGQKESTTKKEFFQKFPEIPLLDNTNIQNSKTPSNIYKILKNNIIKMR